MFKRYPLSIKFAFIPYYHGAKHGVKCPVLVYNQYRGKASVCPIIANYYHLNYDQRRWCFKLDNWRRFNLRKPSAINLKQKQRIPVHNLLHYHAHHLSKMETIALYKCAISANIYQVAKLNQARKFFHHNHDTKKRLNVNWAFVPFNKHTHAGKIRPVVIKHVGHKYISTYPITSRYTTKSSNIKRWYYPIKNWKRAGLKRPSYVDLNHTYQFHKYHILNRSHPLSFTECQNMMKRGIYAYQGDIQMLNAKKELYIKSRHHYHHDYKRNRPWSRFRKHSFKRCHTSNLIHQKPFRPRVISSKLNKVKKLNRLSNQQRQIQ